ACRSYFFFFQAEDGIRVGHVTGVQTCALPISFLQYAAADCRKAIKMVEVCLPAHLFLGHMSKVVGETKLAQKCYQRVLELDPKRSEERRVGKECRCRWSTSPYKKKQNRKTRVL